MNTSSHCHTLNNVTKEELVNTLHQLLLQLNAYGLRTYSERLGTDLDNTPALTAGERVMAKAGHLGYDK